MPVVVVQAVAVLSKASDSDMAGLHGVDAGAGGGDMHGTGIMVGMAVSTAIGLDSVEGGSISGFIHGWARICSNVGRSAGRYSKHRRIRSSHCGDNRSRPGVRVAKLTVARTIWSSCSKGMSPQTMSYSKMPSDQTVAGRPWYLLCRIHSGGE